MEKKWGINLNKKINEDFLDSNFMGYSLSTNIIQSKNILKLPSSVHFRYWEKEISFIR